jgi:hypothetical protein
MREQKKLPLLAIEVNFAIYGNSPAGQAAVQFGGLFCGGGRSVRHAFDAERGT